MGKSISRILGIAAVLLFLALFVGKLFNIVETRSSDPDTKGKTPERIISMLPSLTQTALALDLGKQLVGVTRFDELPGEYNSVTRVGGPLNPSLETVIALKPDLVLLGSMQDELKNKLTELKIDVAVFNQQRMADILKTISDMGDLCNARQKADILCKSIQASLDSIADLASGRPVQQCLLVVSRTMGTLQNMFSCSRNSFLSELLERSGGESIFRDMEFVWAEISVEEIIKKNPQVILDLSGNPESDRDSWNILQTVDAVKTGRVFIMNEKYMTLPGPGIVDIAREFYEALHDDVE
jgi:iron complex transport system substrate-binding protein